MAASSVCRFSKGCACDPVSRWARNSWIFLKVGQHVSLKARYERIDASIDPRSNDLSTDGRCVSVQFSKCKSRTYYRKRSSTGSHRHSRTLFSLEHVFVTHRAASVDWGERTHEALVTTLVQKPTTAREVCLGGSEISKSPTANE